MECLTKFEKSPTYGTAFLAACVTLCAVALLSACDNGGGGDNSVTCGVGTASVSIDGTTQCLMTCTRESDCGAGKTCGRVGGERVCLDAGGGPSPDAGGNSGDIGDSGKRAVDADAAGTEETGLRDVQGGVQSCRELYTCRQECGQDTNCKRQCEQSATDSARKLFQVLVDCIRKNCQPARPACIKSSCIIELQACQKECEGKVTAKCPKQKGVCKGATTTCSSGSFPECGKAQYSSKYEPKETSIDGKDNDCDGVVDNIVETHQLGSDREDEDQGVRDLAFDGSTGDLYVASAQKGEGKVSRFGVSLSGGATWSQQAVSRGRTLGVAVRSAGNTFEIYTAGYFRGTNESLDFDKFDKTGQSLWERDGSHTDLQARGFSTRLSDVAVHQNSGTVYLVGYAKGEVAGQKHHGSGDILLTKWDSRGNHRWTRLVGSSRLDWASALTVDPSTGDVFVGGRTEGGFAGQSHNGSYYNPFVMRYSSTGSQNWVRIMDAEKRAKITDMAFDVKRNALYVSGDTHGRLGNQSAIGGRSDDGFVARYDDSGRRRWLEMLGTTKDDHRGFKVDVDESTGDVYVAGSSEGDFGKKIDSSGYGYSDLAVAKYDNSGNRQWARLLGTSRGKHTAVGDIVVDPDTDDFYIGGSTYGDPINSGPSEVDSDFFIMRRKD